MRTQIFLSAFLAVNACCLGAAPDKIDGFIYYESGRTLARTGYSFAQTHSVDGTYSGIYSATLVTAGIPARLGTPDSGTFTYRKLNENQAELVLGDASAYGTRTLRFTSDTEGTVWSMAIASARFRLARPETRPPLVNCSNRSFIAAGTPAFTGFVISGETERTVLVRAVGPGLAPFGITDFLRNPTLTIIRASTNTAVASNDDWSSENAESVTRTGTTVGAFPLPALSKDAATVVALPPGAYIAQISSTEAGDAGQALIEVYLLP